MAAIKEIKYPPNNQPPTKRNPRVTAGMIFKMCFINSTIIHPTTA